LRGKEKEDEKILTSPHPTLSSGVEREEKAKFFKDTPHFYSLPQGERRE
jgi:hypothetical protein